MVWQQIINKFLKKIKKNKKNIILENQLENIEINQ